jgi:hypothetical protein
LTFLFHNYISLCLQHAGGLLSSGRQDYELLLSRGVRCQYPISREEPEESLWVVGADAVYEKFPLRLRVAYTTAYHSKRLKSEDLGYQNHPAIVLFDSQSKPSYLAIIIINFQNAFGATWAHVADLLTHRIGVFPG